MTDRERLLARRALGEVLTTLDPKLQDRIIDAVDDLQRLAFMAGWDSHRGSEGVQLVDCYEAWLTQASTESVGDKQPCF